VFSSKEIFEKAADGVRVAVKNLTVETADSFFQSKLSADKASMK
jgi:hypothetical protein